MRAWTKGSLFGAVLIVACMGSGSGGATKEWSVELFPKGGLLLTLNEKADVWAVVYDQDGQQVTDLRVGWIPGGGIATCVSVVPHGIAKDYAIITARREGTCAVAAIIVRKNGAIIRSLPLPVTVRSALKN